MTNAIIDTEEQGKLKYALVRDGRPYCGSKEYHMTRKEMNFFLSIAKKFGFVTKFKTYTIEQK